VHSAAPNPRLNTIRPPFKVRARWSFLRSFSSPIASPRRTPPKAIPRQNSFRLVNAHFVHVDHARRRPREAVLIWLNNAAGTGARRRQTP
jgi:hypothetical protein